MAETTHISWCDMTHNHWVGCMKVGPACDGCYAEQLMDHRMHRVVWGAPGVGVGTRALTSEANRRKPLAWDRTAAVAGTRPFVFCSSLADVFDNAVPNAWRESLFDLIHATPNLVWLLLTKRPQNIVTLFCNAVRMGRDWPENAAIGCTVVTQEEADRDIPFLIAAKARLGPAFAFLSMEPLLGPLDLSGWLEPHDPPMPSLDWIIAGGETDQGAHKARPAHPDWFRGLRDQCAAAGVPFHFKQWGEWAPAAANAGPGDGLIARVGKKAAGRALDGVLHDARPAIGKLAVPA